MPLLLALDLVIPMPPLLLLRLAVAAVWLYEGLWNKLLGSAKHQQEVVAAVPRVGIRFGGVFLYVLGVLEVALAVWILTGYLPALCAITQTALLLTLNVNGLLWARHLIPDPGGMVVKNFAFLCLAWITGVLGAQS